MTKKNYRKTPTKWTLVAGETCLDRVLETVEKILLDTHTDTVCAKRHTASETVIHLVIYQIATHCGKQPPKRVILQII